MSLIPERPLVISPALAATIGLEEAVLLQCLSDFLQHRPGDWANGRQWLTLDPATLEQWLPFWNDYDIQRVSKSLQDKGIIELASAPYRECRQLVFALNESVAANPIQAPAAAIAEPAPSAHSTAQHSPNHHSKQPTTAPAQAASGSDMARQALKPQPSASQRSRYTGNSAPPSSTTQRPTAARQADHNPAQQQPVNHSSQNANSSGQKGWQPQWQSANHSQANTIGQNWQPSEEVMKQLAQFSIPRQFTLNQVPEFVTYWSETRESHHAWGSKFIKQVLRRWREHEAQQAIADRNVPMTEQWRPSDEAMELLERGGIQAEFIQQAVPEFVLYWRENGQYSATWSSKFVTHVKRQWARFTHTLQYDTEPQPMEEDWQPSRDVFDVLSLANIDIEFAKSLLPEFVIFWRDSQQLYPSWNTKFLQHVKYHWAKRHNYNWNGNQSNERQQLGPQAGTGQTGTGEFVERHTDSSWADGL